MIIVTLCSLLAFIPRNRAFGLELARTRFSFPGPIYLYVGRDGKSIGKTKQDVITVKGNLSDGISLHTVLLTNEKRERLWVLSTVR